MQNGLLILGINHGGHDTSAALMRDGELIAACEQERYTRDKHSRAFPSEAIHDCLIQSNCVLEDVAEIAYAFDPVMHIQESYLRPALHDAERIQRLIDDAERIEEAFHVEKLIRQETGFNGSISYRNHHLCHLASAYFPSGFDDAVLTSYDGIGEVESGVIAVGRSGKIEVVHDKTIFPDSLGLLYSAVTYFLGWKHHCDEGIVMGLATYGDANQKIPGDHRSYSDVFREIVQLEPEGYGYRINRDWISYHRERNTWVSPLFKSVFGQKREASGDITQHHMDIAAALQARVEEVVLSDLRRVQGQTGLRRLCMAGGVALNCSLNGKVENAHIFDEIFVQPASGDAGVAVGACYLASVDRLQQQAPKKQHNFYLGSGFDGGEIAAAIEQHGLELCKPENIFESTVNELERGRIVGWFQGRAEFGPRALGNRSILTRPFPASMKDYLNEQVKFREVFRPFAPAILYEYLNDYFDISQESPHMLIACQATELGQERIPATVHVDNSCRVQSVRKENNSRFYQLLKAFHSRTACPVLLNTSFNVKGQPIVNSPDEAIQCYLGTNIDCLAIGDFLLTKD